MRLASWSPTNCFFFLEQAHLWKNESLSSDKVTKFYLEELRYSEWLILTLECSLQKDGDIKKCNGPDQNSFTTEI